MMKTLSKSVSGVLMVLTVGCGGNEEIEKETNSPETPESSQTIKQEPTQAAQERAAEEPQKETENKAALREIPQGDLELANGVWCVKGEGNPFTGLAVEYYKDGSKSQETPYVKGLGHGTAIRYNKDGSKRGEYYWENGVFKGVKSF